MLALRNVTATPEQLKIISVNRPGVEIIKGAAGSGKTTTALLRLKSLIGMFVSRRQREQNSEPINVLVLAFNRTLRGYISALAEGQIEHQHPVNVNISTFGKWAFYGLDRPDIIDDDQRRRKLLQLSHGIELSSDFLITEIDYVLTRFLPEDVNSYVTARRDGRGNVPRVDRPLREKIINQIIIPYRSWVHEQGKKDWNDLAVELANRRLSPQYDIIIVDETQDFSANQLRAIQNQLSETHSLTFVVDTAQRIYARGFTWQETGLNVRPEQIKRLEKNYRNTVEIARFAAPLLDGLVFDDDATLPDFSKCSRSGPKPVLIEGKYNEQLSYALNFLNTVNLQEETVAFLKPRGGGWFRTLRDGLSQNDIGFVDLTKEEDWPEGAENVAFCTLHSAKGLEFDHVVMLGLSTEVLQHDTDEEDDQHIMLRKLLAMGISRARNSVILGYKPEDASHLLDHLDEETYDRIIL